MNWLKNKLVSLLTVLITLTLVAYPFAVFYGIQYVGVQAVSLFLAVLFLLRFGFGYLSNRTASKVPNTQSSMPKAMVYISIVGFTLSILAGITSSFQLLQYHPVVINIIMFTVFVHSLIKPPSIIERLARFSLLIKGDGSELPPSAIIYTRKVTIVWSVFFILNASIAIYTCIWGSVALWTLYNGLIAYLLMGTLFAVEFVIRQIVMHRDKLAVQGAQATDSDDIAKNGALGNDDAQKKSDQTVEHLV